MPRITELSQANNTANNDLLVIVSDPDTLSETKRITVNNFFSNVSLLQVNNFILTNNTTPANSTITVTGGSLFADSDYLYYAVANNVLKRITLESF